MENLKRIFFGEGTTKKRFIRDSGSKTKPYYLKKLPFWNRHPYLFVVGGGSLAVFITWSGIFYHALFTDPSTIPPEDLLWPTERLRGITHAERFRQQLKERREKREKKRQSQIEESNIESTEPMPA